MTRPKTENKTKPSSKPKSKKKKSIGRSSSRPVVTGMVSISGEKGRFSIQTYSDGSASVEGYFNAEAISHMGASLGSLLGSDGIIAMMVKAAKHGAEAQAKAAKYGADLVRKDGGALVG